MVEQTLKSRQGPESQSQDLSMILAIGQKAQVDLQSRMPTDEGRKKDRACAATINFYN